MFVLNSLMIDLTFLDSIKKLWEKESLEKVEKCILFFKDDGSDEGTEECFIRFCTDFDSAKNKFINDLRDLPLIMKCRVKGDNNSKFGGQQCAEFMRNIQNACDRYLNSTIYSKDNHKSILSEIISRIRSVADNDETYAWKFENKARMVYSETGKDITEEILKSTYYEDIISKKETKIL